jgi:O-antigen/teichoic acid export membrane protein
VNFSLNRNLIVSIIGRAWTPILSIFLLPVTVKLLGVESYGLVSFYITALNIVNVLDLGLGNSFNRQLSRHSASLTLQKEQPSITRTFEIIIFSISILIGISFYILSSVISDFWIKNGGISHKTVITCIQLMGISIAFQFPQSFYQNGLIALNKQLQLNLFLIFYGTIRVVGSLVILKYISCEVELFFRWHLLFNLVTTLCVTRLFWNSIPKFLVKPIFNISHLVATWRYSIYIFGNSVMSIILAQLDKVMLSKALSLLMFSYYNIAVTLASGISMITGPLLLVIFPQMVKLKEQNHFQGLNSLFHQAAQYLSILVFPIATTLLFFAKPVILLWMNDALIAEESYYILVLFLIGAVINAVASVPLNCSIAFGLPKLVFISYVFQLIVMVPIFYFMIVRYHGIGAGYACILLNSLYFVFAIPQFFKRFFTSELYSWIFYDVLTPLFCCFIIAWLSSLFFPIGLTKLSSFIWFGGTWALSSLISALTLYHCRNVIYIWYKKFFYGKNNST